MTRSQKRRYGFAAGLIVLGFACAAADTGTIGGALATVFVAIGMLLFLSFLFRDLGLSTDSKPRRATAPPPEESPEHGAEHGARPGAPVNGRSHASTERLERPSRMRGERRRLR